MSKAKQEYIESKKYNQVIAANIYIKELEKQAKDLTKELLICFGIFQSLEGVLNDAGYNGDYFYKEVQRSLEKIHKKSIEEIIKEYE